MVGAESFQIIWVIGVRPNLITWVVGISLRGKKINIICRKQIPAILDDIILCKVQNI